MDTNEITVKGKKTSLAMKEVAPAEIDFASFRRAVVAEMKSAPEGPLKIECQILLRIIDAMDDPEAHTIDGLLDSLLANMRVRLTNIAAARQAAAQ